MGALSASMRWGAALGTWTIGAHAAMPIKPAGAVFAPRMGPHVGRLGTVACMWLGWVLGNSETIWIASTGRMGKAGKRQRKFVQKGGLQAAIKHRRTSQKVRRAKAAQEERGEARGARTALHGAPKFLHAHPAARRRLP